MSLEIFLTIFFVLLNGFFVAAEFSIVKVRYSQIQLKAEQGNKLAKKSEYIIKHLDTYLSATQLGITFASLGLGWIGEPLAEAIILKFTHLINVQIPEEYLHEISIIVGFIFITVLHVVFGELVPKSIAIRKAEATTLTISYPLYWFFMILKPFIWLMNFFSNTFLKLIGFEPAGEHEIHSVDELRLLIDQSKKGGEIQDENYEIIKNAFDFTDHTAKQIMVPQHQIFALENTLSADEILENVLDNGYSRIPIYEDSLDNILGIIHAKDLFREYHKNPKFKLSNILNPVFYVYENKLISEILGEFQKEHTHLAIVIDEFGSTQGIITLEDILEELVGEIQDEEDDEKPIVLLTDDGKYAVQATNSIVDINDMLPHPFTESENYTSLSGLILYHFKKIPKINDIITVDGYEITVVKIHRRTIQNVILKEVEKAAPEDEG
jgi:CBS domain containing-hemolysin-like protein